MEPWGTAIFLVLLALAVVGLGAIVSRMVKSIDPNDAAELVRGDALFADEVYGTETDSARARRAMRESDERNEMTWAWRLSALEARVQFHYENFNDANRNATRLIRSLLTRVDHLENEMDTIARTSGNMDVENGADDDSEEERVAAIEVDGYCVHGNPVQFHYEGGCDT